MLKTLLIAGTLLGHTAAAKQKVVFGYLAANEGGWPVGDQINAAFLDAIDDINADADLNMDATWAMGDGQCTVSEAVETVIGLRSTGKAEGWEPDIYIGPACSASAVIVAPLVGVFKRSMISYTAASSQLSDKNSYDAFSRTCASMPALNNAYLQLALKHKWQAVHLAYTTPDGIYTPMAALLKDLFKANGIMVYDNAFKPASKDTYGMKEGWMKDMKKPQQVRNERSEIIGYVETNIIIALMYPTDLRDMLLTANKLGMAEGWTYIMNYCTEGSYGTLPPGMLDDGKNDEARKLFAMPTMLDSLPYADIDAAWTAKLDAKRNDFWPYRDSLSGTVSPIPASAVFTKRTKAIPTVAAAPTDPSTAGFLYDAVMLGAQAIAKTIKEGGTINDRAEINKNVRKVQFTGKTGVVALDANGDRKADVQFRVSSDNGKDLTWTTSEIFYAATRDLKALPADTYTPGTSKFVVQDRFPCESYQNISKTCTSDAKRKVTWGWKNQEWPFRTGDKYNADGTKSATHMLTEAEATKLSCGGAQNADAVKYVGSDNAPMVSCDYVPSDSSSGMLTLILALVGIVVAFGWMVWFVLHRETGIVKASQLTFMLLFCLGSAGACAALLAFVGEATDSACMFRAWAFHITFDLCLGPLFVKTNRVYKVFVNVKMKKVKAGVKESLQALSALVMVDVIILLVWQFVNPMVAVTEMKEENGVLAEFTTCGTEGSFPVVYFAALYKVSLCLYGCYLSFLTKDVNPNFAEAKSIMFALYNVTIFGGICVMLLYAFGMTDPGTKLTMQAVCTTISVVVALMCVNIFKVMKKHLTSKELFDEGAAGATAATSSNKTNTGGSNKVGPTSVTRVSPINQ